MDALAGEKVTFTALKRLKSSHEFDVYPSVASTWLDPLFCRLGATELARKPETNAATLSPRSSRDQTEMYQADGNPPPGRRVSIHFSIAAASFGFPRSVIELPG